MRSLPTSTIFWTISDAALQAKLPIFTAEERAAYLDDPAMQTWEVDGEKMYFEDFMKNILFRDTALFQSLHKRDPFFDRLEAIIFRPETSDQPALSWQPFINPRRFLATGKLLIPGDSLPASGLFQVWIPVPIVTAAQTGVRIISVEPKAFFKTPPSIDAELGAVYFEIDMAEFDDDLEIEIRYEWTRYETRFKIDPENVREYDRSSDLYRRYTASSGNTAVTPEIRALAEKIVDGETNPYRAARRIYDYIIGNIRYSLMAHAMLAAQGIPESVFCHEAGYGDCGMQSAYFSALCRSVGIPARTCGGFQVIPTLEGSHFWAEFYLPNYGWIPVDVTVAETADFTDRITDEQRGIYKNYFFGNLDPYRLVIQSDVDVVLTPRPEDPPPIPMAIQDPVAVCADMAEDASILVMDSWNLTFTAIE